MPDTLRPQVQNQLTALLADGVSVRRAAKLAGCSAGTAQYYRRALVGGTCRCGRPLGHAEWCVMRRSTRALVVAATVQKERGTAFPIYSRGQLPPQDANLLFVLCEHVGRVLSMDDICHRMKLTEPQVRVAATSLRKRLSDEWTVQSVSNKGMRILYVGGELAEADRTYMQISEQTARYHEFYR